MRDPFLSPAWHRVAHLKPRLGRHVAIHRQMSFGQRYHLLQDRLSGHHHRISPDGYRVVAWMDGRRTVDEIWHGIAQQDADKLPSQTAVVRLLAQLHQSGLVLFDLPPDANELFQRTSDHDRRRIWQQLINPLSVKVPLGNPARFLDRVAPLLHWLFRWPGFVLWLAVVLPALALAAMHFRELEADFAGQDLSARNILLMSTLYAVIKVLHELGHAVATRTYGGDVREFGVMLLLGYPMPYVDVSDATSFKSQRRRCIVGAAGILVELFLAAAALYVWLAVEPGAVRAAAYGVMLVSSISTIVFNGNPLLKYDGYFILSDLVGVPNLAQRSARHWQAMWDGYVFGARDAKVRARAGTPHERRWLTLYAPASFAYRMFTQLAIALLVAEQIPSLGILIALVSMLVGVVWPAVKALKHVVVAPALRKVRKRAVGVTGVLLAGAAALLLLVPLPLHSNAEGVVWLPETSFVRAGTSLFLDDVTDPGGRPIAAGEPIASGQEHELASRIAVLEARIAELDARLSAEQFTDRSAAEVTRLEIGSEQSSLAHERAQRDKLTLKSIQSGLLVVDRARDLAGRYVKEGQTVGYVLPPRGRVVRVGVNQEEIDLARKSLRGIEVKLPGWMDATFSAQLLREVPAGTKSLPSKALGMPGGGAIPIDPRDSERAQASHRVFQLEVLLADDVPPLAFGTRLHLRLNHDAEPLAFRLYRGARQLLLARLQA